MKEKKCLIGFNLNLKLYFINSDGVLKFELKMLQAGTTESIFGN